MSYPSFQYAERISELEARVAELEAKLNYDSLTGAFTRQYLFDWFAKSNIRDGHLIFLDLDDFKSVNDYHGHGAGDQLLKLIADAIKAVVSNRGFVVRLSGDEFVIFVGQQSEASFAKLCTSVLSRISETSLDIGSLSVSRTASLGFVRLGDDTDVQKLLDLADGALLEAKSKGKNQSRGLQKSSLCLLPRLPGVDEVRRALREEEIGYHVQPICRSSDQGVEGYEALLRWSRPNGEILGPGQFLDTMTRAYDANTQPPLLAARKTCEWAIHTKSKYISFNISDAFILRIVKDGVGWVDDIIGDVPHDRVVFEVLETVVDRQADHVSAAVCRLRRRGIRVALDDFGVGYSNMERLQRLDVDFVKIDKRFVHGAVDNNRGLDIFESMVNLSTRMSAQSVVEGIETPRHLDLAKQAGADFVQGYLLGRPKPVKDY